jgi:hypothetical protein
VGGDCIGGRGSVVTDWGILGGEGEDKGRGWMRRGRMIIWEEEQCIVA